MQGAEQRRTGWGVVRISPWRLDRIFDTEAGALKRQKDLGADYIVRYGTGFAHSSDFFWDVTSD